ncbi:C40 family peptidase [Dehalobacter sp. DCM]|uniref:C40 family peptidase n=1 Tax=Dehalobacter sp. DCM TaxID=2907827 RepID=UPI00308160BE|nr:C40 family peptidase [Dehalobacter sp. DCM]
MNAALPLEESNQGVILPRQVIGLTACILAGTATIPMAHYPIQEVVALPFDIPGQVRIIDEDMNQTVPLPQQTENIRMLEQKAAAGSFSCTNLRTLSQIESRKNTAEMQYNIINSVMTWEGTAYQWGGRTRSGVDCSALVQNVFKENGIQLPRTSYEQFRMGLGIPQSRLEPGDLVFFHTNGAGASHVGIYIGDKQFISASKHSVQISSLDEPYWAKHYRGSRRVIA